MAEDSELDKRAVEELLSEATRARVRAETMGPAGWMKCPLRSTNKRFLLNTLRPSAGQHRRPAGATSGGQVSTGGRRGEAELRSKSRGHSGTAPGDPGANGDAGDDRRHRDRSDGLHGYKYDGYRERGRDHRGDKHRDHDHNRGDKHRDHDHNRGDKHRDHDHNRGDKHRDHDHNRGDKHRDHDHDRGDKHRDQDHDRGDKHRDPDHNRGDKHRDHDRHKPDSVPKTRRLRSKEGLPCEGGSAPRGSAPRGSTPRSRSLSKDSSQPSRCGVSSSPSSPLPKHASPRPRSCSRSPIRDTPSGRGHK